MNVLLCIFAFLTLFITNVRAVAAQGITGNPMNLTLSPASIVLETDPAKPVKTELKIRNNGTAAEELVIRVETFKPDRTGDRPIIVEPKETDTFISWLHVDTMPFSVNAGEWKTIPIEFSPPEDAALSYYYTIIISREKDPKSAGSETVISGSPAILVLATVTSPNIKRELQVESFTAKHPMVEYLPQEFLVRVRNTGNVHLAPTGNVFIDGMRTKDVAVLSLNPAASTILPGTTREFSVSFENGFPVYMPDVEDGKEKKNTDGTTKRKLSWDFSKADQLRIGQYSAHLLMVYDNGQRDVPIESFVSFWVIPWKLILIAIFLGVLLLVGGGTVLKGIFKSIRSKFA